MNNPHAATVSVVCKCPCHQNPAFMHIVPCCEGRCSQCGQWFISGLSEHDGWCSERATDAPHKRHADEDASKIIGGS